MIKCWNKGLKGYTNSGSFKKGMIPWNKGKNGETYEERFGDERAKEIKENQSKSLKKWYQEHSKKITSKCPNCGKESICSLSKIKKFCSHKCYVEYTKFRKWSPEKIEYLKEHYSNERNTDLSKKLNKTKKSIIAKAFILGLKKSNEFQHFWAVEASRGRIKSEAEKEKVRAKLINKKRPIEVIRKITETKRKNPYKYTDDVKIKMSNAWDYEKHFTEATKEKIRIKRIAFLKTVSNFPNLRKYTDIEEKVENILVKLGFIKDLDFHHNKRIPNSIFTGDFVFLNKRISIECDGDYWHSLDRVKKADERKNKELESLNWKIIRFSGSDILNNEDNVKQQLQVLL